MDCGALCVSETPEESIQPLHLLDLPDELLERLLFPVAFSALDFVRFACCCRRLSAAAILPWATARCNAMIRSHGVKVPPHSEAHPFRCYELLHVIDVVADLGSNRVLFQKRGRSCTRDSKPSLKAGSSPARIQQTALLLRRHCHLRLAIDGHEAEAEGVVHIAADGSEVRASLGASEVRAEAARDAILELECLRGLDAKRGHSRVWGRLPLVRFGPRMTVRGWQDAVAQAAGWTGVETCQAELYFTLHGAEFPSRPDHYRTAAESYERGEGWRRYFANSSG